MLWEPMTTTAEEIELELRRAQTARAEGIPGKVRVCARRAAGAAIRGWLGRQPKPPEGWLKGGAVVQHLRLMKDNARLPEPVRAAAGRLATNVQPDHAMPFANDPVEDARIIIEYLAQ